jgi:hypothetical protein
VEEAPTPSEGTATPPAVAKAPSDPIVDQTAGTTPAEPTPDAPSKPTGVASTVALPPPISLDSARNAALLAGIYLYFAGFVYRDFFSHELGVPADSSTPVYTYISYAYDALSVAAVPIVAIVVALFTYHAIAREAAARKRIRAVGVGLARIETAVFALVAIALFPFIFVVAQTSAVANARSLRLGELHFATPVVVTFNPNAAASYDSAFLKANGASGASVFLVSQSSDTYYVLYQPTGPVPFAVPAERTYLPAADVIAIPKTDVEHITTILPNDQAPMPASH